MGKAEVKEVEVEVGADADCNMESDADTAATLGVVVEIEVGELEDEGALVSRLSESVLFPAGYGTDELRVKETKELDDDDDDDDETKVVEFDGLTDVCMTRLPCGIPVVSLSGAWCLLMNSSYPVPGQSIPPGRKDKGVDWIDVLAS